MLRRVLLISLAASAGMMLTPHVLRAQLPSVEEPPTMYVPIGPTSQMERDRRESLYQYALGVLCERDDRLLEALTAFEKAARLDPRAAGVFKAQVPLLLALERAGDAIAAARKTLDLDPADYEVWHLYARLLKEMNKLPEARDALLRGLAVPAVKEELDVLQQMTFDLALIHEAAENYPAAGDAYSEAAKILDHPDAFLDRGHLTRERIVQRVAEIHERAGRMYTKARQYEKALAAYRLAQEHSPELAGRLNYYLAQIFHDKKEPAEALQHIEAYLRLQPQGLEAYEMKIALLRELNRAAEIAPWLEQALKNDSYNVGLKVLLARQLVDAKQTERAEKLFLELAVDHPSPDLYVGLFRPYPEGPQRGNIKALALLDRTLEEARARPPIPGRAAQAKAMLMAARQDADLAKALILAGGRASLSLVLHADTYLLLAALAEHHRDTTEAEYFFRRALKGAAPENELLAYGGLLRLYWKANKLDEIVQLCREGQPRAQVDNQVLLYSEMAKALVKKGKIDEALEAADRASALASLADRLALSCLRVRLLTHAERYDRAEAECQRLLKQHNQPGEQLEIRYLLASVYS